MGEINTGCYGCFEGFVRSLPGKQGMVIVKNSQNMIRKYPSGNNHYRLLRIPLECDATYQVELEDCEVSICYLSESREMLDQGVRFLEYREGRWEETKNLKKWYQTPGREQYHFCAYKNWINDPNGLCWYQGYYHMYYQANPHSQEWDQMYWGHTVSKDCVHWVHLPYALEPQEELLDSVDRKGGAFSGSAAVLDHKIRFYLTRHEGPQEDSEEETLQYQTMVESADGIHFGEEKTIIYKPNEEFSFNFRDPKVIWYEGKWRMVIGARVQNTPVIVQYESEDGENWEYKGIILEEKTEGVYTIECPDMFPLDGRMVLTGACMFYSDEYRRFQPTYYYIGEYKDGKFTAETKGLYDFIGNFYAVQSFEHAGRQIAIGWIADLYHEHCPEKDGAYGSMAIPRELQIKNGKLYRRPIREIYQLKGQCFCKVEKQNVKLKHLNQNTYYAEVEFVKDTNFDILLGNSKDAQLRLVRNNQELRMITRGVHSHFVDFVTTIEHIYKLEIFMDRRVAEIFVNDGEEAGTKLFYQEQDGVFDAKFTDEDAVKEIAVYEMKGIWR